MMQSIQMWVEVPFNLAYLSIIWGLVIAMIYRHYRLLPTARPLPRLFIWAFGLLALGDTGHVGLRVMAYVVGDLETTFTIFGDQFAVVGLGELTSSVTVTFFYVVLLVIWQRRFNKNYGWFGSLLFIASVVRLAIMIFPQNQWSSAIAPHPWSIYRNLPLMVQGLGVAYLILRDAIAAKDLTFKWIGRMILVSYAFYVPVILFVRIVPMIGMLMIPKTLAYLALAFIAFFNLFRLPSPERHET